MRQLNIPCTDIFKKMKKCDLDLLHDLFFCSICHAKLGESVAMRSIVFYLLLFHSVIALKLVGMEGFPWDSGNGLSLQTWIAVGR